MVKIRVDLLNVQATSGKERGKRWKNKVQEVKTKEKQQQEKKATEVWLWRTKDKCTNGGPDVIWILESYKSLT